MKKLFRSVFSLFSHPRYGEVLRFILTGGATTAVSYLFYLLCYYLILPPFPMVEMVCNAIGWFFAVIFSFFVTKFFVFRSTDRSAGRVAYEFITFFATRIFSGLIEIPLPSLLIETIGMHHLAAKLVVSVFVVICNFLTSKFISFRKSKKGR